jgi:anti-sigma factor RsiW
MDTGRPDTGNGHDRWSDRLSEYLDGGMKAADRARLEAHLADCAACSVALAELREVVERARTLEDAPPPVDLWPAIEAQLAPRTSPRASTARATVVDGRRWWSQRFELGLPQLAAAAVLLVMLSSGAMWLTLRRPALPVAAPGPAVADRAVAAPGAPTLAPAPTAAVTPSGPRRPPVAGAAIDAMAASGNPGYDAAVADLERTLEEGRGRLDPNTLAVVERNLNIIDRAIDEARRAVAADPGNTWLRSHLAATMKRKVDLLRSATMLATTQS